MHSSFRSLTIAVLLASVGLPALALDLQQARSQGLVGEQRDGFVSPLKPSPEVQALVAQVNARRGEYERISKEKGQTPDVVGTLAAGQIVENLAAGSMYQDAGGSWKKK